MIITTVEELRLHLPNHAYDDIDSMAGAFRRSEADVLKEKVGKKLYKKIVEKYNGVADADKVNWLLQENGVSDPYGELTYLCQQVVVFDAFLRSADVNAISINQSGINQVSAENYDSASKDFVANYKRQLNKEVHAAVNRLLVWLEDAEKENENDNENENLEGNDNENENENENGVESSAVAQQSESESESQSESEAIAEIITLWKESKFYYYYGDLFINTATMMQMYVDIYESREKFVQLLPDLRFCQMQCIENEIGEDMTQRLLDRQAKGNGTKEEIKAINMIREALALCVEARSPMFNRPQAKDEAIGSIQRMSEYVQKVLVEANTEGEDVPPQPRVWENNRKGNAMFVMPVVY